MAEYKEYNIRIFPAAQNDLLDIMETAGSISPEVSARYYDSLREKFEKLTTAPDTYPLARDTLLRIRGYRTLPVENYVVFYIIKGKTVELYRILCARRQYARLL